MPPPATPRRAYTTGRRRGSPRKQDIQFERRKDDAVKLGLRASRFSWTTRVSCMCKIDVKEENQPAITIAALLPKKPKETDTVVLFFVVLAITNRQKAPYQLQCEIPAALGNNIAANSSIVTLMYTIVAVLSSW